MQRARACAGGASGRVIAMVFDPHPLAVLRPGSEPARLSSSEDRSCWLEAAGASEVHRLDPAGGVLGLEPDAFVGWVAERFNPTHWVEGPDFRFGKARAGDVVTLRVSCAARGIAVEVMEDHGVALADQQIVPCRSATVRWLLEQRRVFDAAALLGRWHTLVGTVVQGDRRGRTIGFPTANLETLVVPPGAGVYAGIATLPSGAALAAAVNIGARPTFDRPSTVEVHVLNAERWSEVGPVSEYGWTLRVELVSFLRDTVRFGSVAELREQLGRDCQRAADVALAIGSGADAQLQGAP